MSIFSERMKELRTLAELTQQEVAEQLHLDKQTISQYELGKRQPDFEKLERISDFYNVSTDFLLGVSDKTPRLVSMNKLAGAEQGSGKRIPLLGSVIAGVPTEAMTAPSDDVVIPASWSGEYGALRVKGNSMTPALQEGDIVIFQKQADADSGDLVIALINGTETTVKKLVKGKNKITLQPFNPSYDPIMFEGKKRKKTCRS